MRYWHIIIENNNLWLEVDNNGVVLRQIICSLNDVTQLSCYEDCLAEGTFNPLDMEGAISETTEVLFEEEWQKHTKKNYAIWLGQKLEYAIGKSVHGKVLYYYPQGCIVKLDNAMGCVSEVKGGFKIGDEIQGVISDYDEQNMWIIMSIMS